MYQPDYHPGRLSLNIQTKNDMSIFIFIFLLLLIFYNPTIGI
jgi:hypothetical protein